MVRGLFGSSSVFGTFVCAVECVVAAMSGLYCCLHRTQTKLQRLGTAREGQKAEILKKLNKEDVQTTRTTVKR